MKERKLSSEMPQSPQTIYDAIKISNKYIKSLEKKGKPWKKIESIGVNQNDKDKKGEFVLNVFLYKKPKSRDLEKMDKEFKGVPIVYDVAKINRFSRIKRTLFK